MSRHVLFVSHEGTRTGAPMMLLHFVRWLADHSDLQVEVALIRGGPLAPAFADAAPTTVLSESLDWPEPEGPERTLRRLHLDRTAWAVTSRRVRRELAALADTDAIYLNSTGSLRILNHLPRRPTIAHVHELRAALHWSLRPEDPPLLRTHVDRFVAAADCVADNLVDSYQLDPAAITRVYEFVDAAAVVAPPHRPAADIRAELGLDPEAPVVGGSGFADWRKGIDLFVELARRTPEVDGRPVHFVWVGDRAGGREGRDLDVDLAHAGLGDRLHLVGLRDHPFDWYRTFDLFALTSREDPYPLVGLETALLEVPMVCFDAGGMTELVHRSRSEGTGESGIVVPYLDVEAMAAEVTALLGDRPRREAMGARAAAVVGRDHDVGATAPALLEVVEQTLAEGRR